jgi:hypothetical protein
MNNPYKRALKKLNFCRGSANTDASKEADEMNKPMITSVDSDCIMKASGWISEGYYYT